MIQTGPTLSTMAWLMIAGPVFVLPMSSFQVSYRAQTDETGDVLSIFRILTILSFYRCVGSSHVRCYG